MFLSKPTRAVCFVPLVVWILTSPTFANEEIVQALEKQGAELPITSFELDTTLSQKVDRINKVSSYRLPAIEDPIYTRDDADDSSKEVVVLKDAEDKLPYQKTKRIYIVLRKKEAGVYFVTAAAVRDAAPADKDVAKVSSGGKEYIIEWLSFDHHFFPSKNLLLLRAYFCVFSYITPCSFNTSVLTPPEKFVKSPKYISKGVEGAQDKFVTTDGSDPEENYNFYADLEVRPKGAQAGRFVGQVVGAAVGGAFGIVCGVVGAVFGFGERCNPPPETVIIHETLPPVVAPMTVFPGAPGGPGDPAMAIMGRRKKRQAEDPLDDYPGWMTQFTVPTAASSLKHTKDVFFGFGGCPETPVDPKELDSAKTDDQIINFYLKVLRADCLLDRVVIIPKLISEGALVVKDKGLHINEKNPRLTGKMSLKGFLELSTGVELCFFSSVYNEESKNSARTLKSPDGLKSISGSIDFVTKFVYKYLSGTRTKARSHLIQLSRNLVLTLQAIFDKLRQDKQNLEKCSDCKEAKEINANDRLQVVSLLEFVKYGLHPVDQGEDPQKTFTDFFTKNVALLTKLA